MYLGNTRNNVDDYYDADDLDDDDGDDSAVVDDSDDYDEMIMTLYWSYDYVIYHLGRLPPNNTFCCSL